jgi:oligopeptide transport system substrate-binding protein
MGRFRGLKALAVTVGGLMAVLACGPTSSGGGGELAADQTLRYSALDDVETLDPAHVSAGTDIPYDFEVFSGLYRFDNDLNILPDIATAKPDISSDGKTYTFKMRKDVKFSNGDALKADDVIYSWNRAAALNDAYATVFDPLVGGPDTEAGKTKTISGLSKGSDDYTIVAKLSDPAGYWLSELALWTAAVVDRKVIEAKGEDKWWTTPDGLIGAGPYKMTERTPKASMAFEQVSNWWGGSDRQGKLKKVKVDFGVDQSSSVKKYESGGYDIVGFAGIFPDPEDILRYKNDPAKSKQLTNKPLARTTWVGFNFTKGPFQGTPGGNDPGKQGRIALNKAIDRSQMADVACSKGILCTPATGGYIAKGLKGYVGDNSDPNAKFDASGAKSTYSQWDPTGSKVAGLKYSYNTTAVNKKVAENLQSQWKNNLNINVDLDPSDFPALLKKRKAKDPILFRDSWGADYDHPQDWFDNLFTCAQAPVGKGNSAGYCNPAVDKIVAKADAEQIDKANSEYQQAGKMMISDVFGAELFYSTGQYFTKDYVKGAGLNALYDYRWEGITIQKH